MGRAIFGVLDHFYCRRTQDEGRGRKRSPKVHYSVHFAPAHALIDHLLQASCAEEWLVAMGRQWKPLASVLAPSSCYSQRLSKGLLEPTLTPKSAATGRRRRR